jgi:hypothetical protein
MTDQSLSLVIQGHETAHFSVQADVLQGSLLSPILFLFYISELLKIYNQPKERLSEIGFADNVNLLAYSQSTEANCQTLERAYTKLLK